MLTVEPVNIGLPSWEMANVVPLLDNWRSRTAAEIVAVKVRSNSSTGSVDNILEWRWKADPAAMDTLN